MVFVQREVNSQNYQELRLVETILKRKRKTRLKKVFETIIQSVMEGLYQ